MPGSSGIVFLHELRRLERSERVLVVTMHAHAELAAEAFSVTPRLPLATIEDFLKQKPHQSGARGVLAALSARERQILDLLVCDYTQEQIAAELCIGPKTVVTDRSAVFRKLLVSDLGGASDQESPE